MQRVKKKKELNLTMSNSIVRASHSLTVAERRILMLAISKLDQNKEYKGNPLVRVHASEIMDMSGVSKWTAYDEAKAAQKKLYDRSITLACDPETGKPKDGYIRWINRAHYQKGEGWIEVALSYELLPYFIGLKKEFTKYNHQRTGGFRSIYSYRLFDMVMQFKRTGLVKIGIDEFADAIEAPKSFRVNFSNLRKKVLEVAIKEIKEKDGLDIKYSVKKTGRKVTSLEFTFPVEQQKTIPLNQSQTTTHKPVSKAKQAKDKEQADHLTILSKIEGAKELSELSGEPIEILLTPEQLEVYQQQQRQTA